MLRRDGADVNLWAMAAELERQFAGYKQRLAERSNDDAAADDADAHHGGGENSGGRGEEAEAGGGGDVRGRMYEAYTRRRDERLRVGWRARMERKEAEVKALWAELERSGRERTPAPGGGAGPPADDGTVTAGEQEAEDDGEKRRSSDFAPIRISGKKHARTRSFSLSATKSSRPDAGRRRALSQEPPPSSEPPAGADASRKDSRRSARPVGAGMAAPKRKTVSAGNKSSGKEHGSGQLLRPPGAKPPRSLPRRFSSGCLKDLKEAVLPNTDMAAPPVVQSSLSELQTDGHDGSQTASSPMPFVRSGDCTGGSVNARAASPDSDCGEVVDNVVANGGETESKNVDVEKRNADIAEESTRSPERFGYGEITSDSETEPSYVYIKKDDAEEEAMRLSEALAGPDAELHFEGKNGMGNTDEATAPSDANIAAEITTTSAEEAPARSESSDEYSLSGRSGCSPPNNSLPPSCSSRARSIERLLEADAALLRKKREESAEKSVVLTPPGSAGSRASAGTARSPRETPRGFKRFLSFGKKNGGRDATVIDCTSPSVPSSLVDDESASGGWHSTESIKPRMGSSDAASDDIDHDYGVSPQACSLQSLVAASPAKSELNEIHPQEKSPKGHRSFFSFRAFNCGRS